MKKIIANRVMLFMMFYVIISGILVYYSLVFALVFPNRINTILACVIGLMFFALPYGFYYSVVKPTRAIDHSFRQFHTGQNLEPIKNAQVHLTTQMSEMIEALLVMSENVQSIKVSNLHSEYRALQNQINPHFLYNTLEAVRSDALVAGNQEIADVTEALATFFRYTISNMDHLVTLEDELINVANYFKIQNYRFGEKISLTVDYGERAELLKATLPKLILQPIVENAILHGLEHKVERGQIAIKIHETQNRVIIDVIDDGVGIQEETLDRINNRMELVGDHLLEKNIKKGGIALMNVNNRIKLTFGDIYGIRLSSVLNYGTTVNISIPKKAAG